MANKGADGVVSMTLGVMGHSAKENEYRLALHPEQLPGLSEDIRKNLFFENGYGSRFGTTDAFLSEYSAGVLTETELRARCDIILQPKPVLKEIQEMREHQVLWGWPHLVQGPDLTELVIKKKLTVIAFENMNYLDEDGRIAEHVFKRNNELAGYCSVVHAMQCAGRTGHYGKPIKAVVIGYGATGTGAVLGLQAMGVSQIAVVSKRARRSLQGLPRDVMHYRLLRETQLNVETPSGKQSSADFLSQFDIVVNCTLQNPLDPLMFINESDIGKLKSDAVVVDISCDEGMGFSWAHPTSFDEPVVELAGGPLYYAVDHTPSLLWNSATWENSMSIRPFLRSVMSGPDCWASDPVISAAIEVQDGVIKNPAITEFQSRETEYPHAIRASMSN